MGLEQAMEQTSSGSQHTGHSQMICAALLTTATQIIWLWPVCCDPHDVCSFVCSKPISVIYIHCSWVCLSWLPTTRAHRLYTAAMDIDYTDGLGAGNGANIIKIIAYWSQSNDLCCIADNCNTNHLIVTSVLWSSWCLLLCLLQAH